MRPNLRHLHVFREVARRGSASAAARSSHLSQPSVTQAISGVENYFGAALFERNSAGMRLTDAGRACLSRVDAAIEQLREGVVDATRARLRDAPGPAVGELRAISSAQLQALVDVVQHGAFGRAARASGVSRPTVHRAARRLEAALGVALFERTSFGVRPTREAERLARRTQLAFAALVQARAEVGELAGRGLGRTVIGAMPLARSYLVPATVNEFCDRHPGHAISILDGSYDSMLHALRAGGADFLVGALRNPAPFADVVEEPLFDDPIALIMRAGHPLAQRRTPSVAALVRYPWVAPSPGTPLRRQFDELFAQFGRAAPPNPIECNSLVAARALLLASDRIMLSSAQQVHFELATGRLVVRPHPGGCVLRSIGVSTRRDWRPTAVQGELLQILRRHAASTTHQAG